MVFDSSEVVRKDASMPEGPYIKVLPFISSRQDRFPIKDRVTKEEVAC